MPRQADTCANAAPKHVSVGFTEEHILSTMNQFLLIF